MSFLPDGYKKVPSNSDYMKLVDGLNTFRVLGAAVVGYIYWNVEDKPVRSKTPFSGIPADIRTDKDGMPEKIKHFWSFPVWNYDEERVQILEIPQKQVQTQMKALVDNPRWGDPKMYDITVTRSGSGFDTEYVVQPNPPIAPVDPKIAEAYAKKPVNLEALFTGADPFAAVKSDNTPAGVVSKVQAATEMQDAELDPIPLDPTPIDGEV